MYVPLSQMYRKNVPSGPSLLNDRDNVQTAPDGTFIWMLISIAILSSGCGGPWIARATLAFSPV